MPTKRATSAATPTDKRRAAKTPPAGAESHGGVSWMSSYLETCSREDKAMRDMVKMVEDAGFGADISLRNKTWCVELFDVDAATGATGATGEACGADLTDVLSRAWVRQQEAARAAKDAKQGVGP